MEFLKDYYLVLIILWVVVLPFIYILLVHLYFIIYCNWLKKLSEKLETFSGKKMSIWCKREKEDNKIEIEFENKEYDIWRRLEYYLEYKKSLTDIKWKTFNLLAIFFAILWFIVKFIYNLLNNKTNLLYNFNNYVFAIVLLWLISIWIILFRYANQERKRLEFLQKLYSQKK